MHGLCSREIRSFLGSGFVYKLRCWFLFCCHRIRYLHGLRGWQVRRNHWPN